MYIDVHCHLDMCRNVGEIIENAKKVGVERIITNGVNPKSNRISLKISEAYEEVRVAVGIYPIDALSLNDEEINEEIEFIRENKDKIAAIGEVGIDMKESTDFETQKKNFEKFVLLAKEINKPIIVHSRKAEEKAIEILEEKKAKRVVMHCFNGNMKLVERIVKNNWHISIPTNVKNSEHFQKVIALVPITNLLCETDSPYLHPDKLENNEPSNVIESYKKIAEIKGIDIKKVEKEIESNYKKLF